MNYCHKYFHITLFCLKRHYILLINRNAEKRNLFQRIKLHFIYCLRSKWRRWKNPSDIFIYILRLYLFTQTANFPMIYSIYSVHILAWFHLVQLIIIIFQPIHSIILNWKCFLFGVASVFHYRNWNIKINPI